MPARIVLQPDVWDVLLQQVQDENAALHAENGRLRAENERLRDEGNAKDAEIERQRAAEEDPAEFKRAAVAGGEAERCRKPACRPGAAAPGSSGRASFPVRQSDRGEGHAYGDVPALCRGPLWGGARRGRDVRPRRNPAGPGGDHPRRPAARNLPMLPRGVQGGTAAGDGTGIAVWREPAGDSGAPAAVPRRLL